MGVDPLVRPVLKWAGGKRQLLAEISEHIPTQYESYYEPFLGGGAVLFAYQPQRAVVNDVNSELINVYQVIRDYPDQLIADLKGHRNEAKYYYRIRGLDRDPSAYEKLSAVEKASRILYLNKTCYNGLFRVNSKGQFNVPFGRYRNPNIVNEEGILAVSDYLKEARVSLRCGDFAEALRGVGPADFVYFDPPYDPLSSSSNFTSYDSAGFGREEQLRLRRICSQLDRQGVRFLLSNAATDFIKGLYQEYRLELVQANRAVNSKGRGRGPVAEVLIKNY